MGIPKLVRHTLVTGMPMPVVIRQSSPRVLELFRRFNCVGIVVAQNPLAIRLVQCQRVTNTVRDVLADCDLPSFDLDPVTIVLINDLVVEFNKGSDTGIFAHG